MMRLVFADLRDHVATWIGAFVVAVACGYIGGWVVSLQETASFYESGLHWSLQNASNMMLLFSLVAGVAVLALTANLTVSVQRHSYALWQLLNVRPWLVSVVLFVQLATVAALGAFCGTLFSALTFDPLFPWVFSTADALARVVPRISMHRMPVVWLAVVAVFLCGGLKSALLAGKTPPLLALCGVDIKRKRMTCSRVLLFVGLCVCMYVAYSYMIDSSIDRASSWAVFIPILVVSALADVGILIFSALLSLWTSLVPWAHWLVWHLARHTARHGLTISTSIETPVMVAFGLVAGFISMLHVFAKYAQMQGSLDVSGWSLDLTTALLLLGGPVLLCAVGTAVSVVMSSRSRSRDVALLIAAGARPQTLVAAAACEAFIHATTATLVGVGAVVISNGLIAYAVGLPLFDNLAFAEGFTVSLIGFFLILAATLVPTCAALGREPAAVLTVQE